MAISLYDFWDNDKGIFDVFRYVQESERLNPEESKELHRQLTCEKDPELCKDIVAAGALLRRIQASVMGIKTKHREKMLEESEEYARCSVRLRELYKVSREKLKAAPVINGHSVSIGYAIYTYIAEQGFSEQSVKDIWHLANKLHWDISEEGDLRGFGDEAKKIFSAYNVSVVFSSR